MKKNQITKKIKNLMFLKKNLLLKITIIILSRILVLLFPIIKRRNINNLASKIFHGKV